MVLYELFISVPQYLQDSLYDNCGVNLSDFGRPCFVETKTPSGTQHPTAVELAPLCEGEELNPVTTDGWRWTAPELMSACRNGEHGSTPVVSEAVDIYAFGMTVIEVRVSVVISQQADTRWLTDLHWIHSLFAHQM